jgi:hypothetical protein
MVYRGLEVRNRVKRRGSYETSELNKEKGI